MKKSILYVVVAGVCFVMAGLLFFTDIFSPPPPPEVVEAPPPPPPPEDGVLVVRQPIKGGVRPPPASMSWESRLVSEIPFNAIRYSSNPSALNEIFEKVALHDLIPGSLVFNNDFASVGGGPLALSIEPGMRAYTIRVDDTSNVAGFLAPGDSIDLVLLRANADTATANNRPMIAELLEQDVKILAIDQRFALNSSGNEIEPGRVVTIEVSPSQMVKISESLARGRLSVSLRNPLDDYKLRVSSGKEKSKSDEVFMLYGTSGQAVVNCSPKCGQSDTSDSSNQSGLSKEEEKIKQAVAAAMASLRENSQDSEGNQEVDSLYEEPVDGQ